MSNKSTTQTDAEIGKRILWKRISNGLTMQDIAKVMDITHQQWSKYEKGINRIYDVAAADMQSALCALHLDELSVVGVQDRGHALTLWAMQTQSVIDVRMPVLT